jgi:hypothetical protein
VIHSIRKASRYATSEPISPPKKCSSSPAASDLLRPSPTANSGPASGRGISITSRVIAMAKTASVKKPTRSGVRPAGVR